MRANPWDLLREREHLVFGLCRLPDGVDAVYWPRGDRAAILIDERLDRTRRRAALLHELIHDERGGGSPDPWASKEEEIVDREVARRLVPLGDLIELIARLEELGEPVHAATVAEEFDVPLDVAQRALWLLGQRGLR